MGNKIIRARIYDPELGDVRTTEEIDNAIKAVEGEIGISPEEQVPTSGLPLESLRDFQKTFFEGDVDGAKAAIEATTDPGTKAAMGRLMKYV